MRALYRPQKVKGRPSDFTLEKIIQKSCKYNSDSVLVLETELTKEKGMFLGLVRPSQRFSDRFLRLSRIFGIPK